MLRKFSGEENTDNLYGRDRQVPTVKNCRFTQTAFGTVGQYETEDAAVEMIREMAQGIGGHDNEI